MTNANGPDLERPSIDSEPCSVQPTIQGSESSTFSEKQCGSADDRYSDEALSIPWRIIKNFSAVWFTISMDTGVLSIVLHQFPYPSHWTRVCSTIMFVTNIVLFLTFGAVYLLKWTVFRRFTYENVRKDSEYIALQACPAISWLTLVTQVQLTCAESWGYGFTLAAFVMWWMGLVWVFSVCILLYLHLMKHPSGDHVDRWLPTAVFIPIVGVLTVGNTAGVIVNSAANHTHLPDSLAVPLILIGFMCVGFGVGLGLVMYAVYAHRLFTSGWPAPLKIPSMILTIGPCGQSASALIQLGNAAVFHKNFGRYAKGYFLSDNSAEIIRVVCVLAALLLVGFAIFWMCIDYYAIIEGLIAREIHPSLFWWSTIFPVGTVVTALSNLGSAMNSPAFRIFAVILFVFLLCIYCIDASFTIPMALSGELFGLPRRVLWCTRGINYVHAWGRFPRETRMS